MECDPLNRPKTLECARPLTLRQYHVGVVESCYQRAGFQKIRSVASLLAPIPIRGQISLILG